MDKFKVKKIKIFKKEDCDHCCHKDIHICPKCGFKGLLVPTKTVIHLSQNYTLDENEEFYICTNPKCNTTYFCHDVMLEKQDISTKIWYKSPIEDFIVCYCHNIKLLDIIEAVAYLGGNNNKEDVLNYLNKNIQEKKCDILNPIGQNCDRVFENALEYAKEVYEGRK